MKTKRELAEEQIAIQHEIQRAGFNIVICGNCDQVILHRIDDNDELECIGCGEEMDKSDCSDLWYTGCAESAEFNEDTQ